MKTLALTMLLFGLLGSACTGPAASPRTTVRERYYIEGALLKQPTKQKKVFWMFLEPAKDSPLALLSLEEHVLFVRERLKKEGWEFTNAGDDNYVLMVSFRLLDRKTNEKEFMVRAPLALEVRFDMVDRAVYWGDTTSNGMPTDTAIARSKIWATILTAYTDHDHWPSILLNLMQKGGGEVGSYNAPARVLGDLVLPR